MKCFFLFSCKRRLCRWGPWWCVTWTSTQIFLSCTWNVIRALKKKKKSQLVSAFLQSQSDKFVQSGPFPKRLFPTKTWRAQAIWLMTSSRCRLGGAGARFAATDLDSDLKEQNYCPVWNISPDVFLINLHIHLFLHQGPSFMYFFKLKNQSFPLIKLLEYMRIVVESRVHTSPLAWNRFFIWLNFKKKNPKSWLMLIHCSVQVIHIKDFQRFDEEKSSDDNNSLHGPLVAVLA